MKLYDGYKQFVGRQICLDLTETMEAWSNVNTFVGSSQHIGQLCRLHKSVWKKKSDGNWIT